MREKNIRFASEDHQEFFFSMMENARKKDSYHRAFFYLMGISSETRTNIHQMFDFDEDSIKPDGIHAGWQTGSTTRLCHLALNLWNGYYDPEQSQQYTPDDLFCCEFAPFFVEGIKLRFPEYFSLLP